MQNKKWFSICAALVMTPCLAFGQAKETAAVRVSSDYDSPASLTCGIQEAVDRLQERGGTVYIPEGTNLLQNPIILKKGTKLVGSGSETILRKAPLVVAKLAQDAKKGQEFVVVEDASRLKAGMMVVLAEIGSRAGIWRHFYTITKIEDGNRVFLKGRSWNGLLYDCSVAKEARIMTHSMGIWPAANCVIADLSLDGAADTQMPEEAVKFCSLYKLVNGIYPLNSATKVEHCWVYNWLNDGIQVNGSENYVTIRDCTIFNNRGYGIHPGGGPRTIITQNNIYSNQASGVYFCYGNRALIVTENFIHENGDGIGGINAGDMKIDTTQDAMSIIANNIIYRNKGPGITTSWQYSYGDGGGPKNFIISGNVIENNLLAPKPGEPPAGIVLINAEDCVITGNRVVDDQDTFERALAADANPGHKTIRIPEGVNDHINVRFPGAGKSLHIEDAEGGETCIVTNITKRNTEYTIELGQPLQHEYRVDRKARIAGVKTQAWGILCVHTKEKARNRGNVITANIVTGNGLGGILWAGTDMNVSGNIGPVAIMDEARPLKEQLAQKP